MPKALYVVEERTQPTTLLMVGAFSGAPAPAEFTEQTSDFAAVPNDIMVGGTQYGAYSVSGAAGPVVVTLPDPASEGDKIVIKATDLTNQVSIDPAAGTIQNVVGPLIVGNAMLNQTITLTYDAAEGHWVAIVG